MIIKDLKQYLPQLTSYTELRSQENRVLNIAYLQGNLVQNVKATTSGISARSYRNGSWGFASSPNRNAIGEILKEAQANAIFLDQRENKGLGAFQPDSPLLEKNFATKKPRLNQKEIMTFTKEIDNYIAQKYPDLTSRSIRLSCLDIEKSLITSDGAFLYSLLPRSLFMVAMSSDKGGSPVDLFDSQGGLGQFEDNFSSPEELYPMIDQLYERLSQKCEGVHARAGLFDCILAPELAGILAHEAIGHTTEADMVLSGSVAGDYLDEKVASPLVSLVDFANSYNDQHCPVPIYIDDEGSRAEDAVIIDQGILKGFMHNKQTANSFAVKPTGNGRAYQYFDEPLIRMRNTAILPGSDNLEKMIASVEDGYYLINTNNGQADTTSEFMFGVVFGYEIKNGQLGKAIKDTTISGVAFDVLKNITMVSGDMEWSASGMCGKKQAIPVGMGGPALKTKINIGGR